MSQNSIFLIFKIKLTFFKKILNTKFRIFRFRTIDNFQGFVSTIHKMYVYLTLIYLKKHFLTHFINIA